MRLPGRAPWLRSSSLVQPRHSCVVVGPTTTFRSLRGVVSDLGLQGSSTAPPPWPAARASGVAARDPSRGTLDELIFDPKTYLYIGDSESALNSTYMPKGTVNGNAVEQIAVVGKPGQLP